MRYSINIDSKIVILHKTTIQNILVQNSPVILPAFLWPKAMIFIMCFIEVDQDLSFLIKLINR